jgi:hypothetical protein
MDLPLPANWQEFEKMTRDAMALKWDSPNLTLNGRPGQAQHGVDIYGPDYIGRMTGIQCKRCEGPLKLTVITDEVGNAEKFPGPLATLYIATTADTDATLQAEVRKISEQRSASRQFGVGLLFWEDVITGLARNHEVLAAHYPQLKLNLITGSSERASDRLAAINLGYYGRHLSQFYDLTFSEIGWMAGQDPYEFQGILRILGGSLSFLPESEQNQLSDWLSDIDQRLFKSGERKRRDYESMIPHAPEANFIELGSSIGFVYHSDQDFTREASERMFRQIATLFPTSIPRLRERLSRMADVPGYTAGPRLFGFIDAELRWGDATGAVTDKPSNTGEE